MKKFFTYLCGFLACHIAAAQQDAQFSQYMFNQLYLNPATAGINPKQIEFNLIHRTQWFGYEGNFDDGGAPTSQVASVNLPFAKFNSGIGLHFVNDRLGAISNQEVQFSYAYHIKVNRSRLSMGLRAGLYNHAIDQDLLRAVEPDDPLIQNLAGTDGQFRADFAFGLYFTPSNDKYFIGASVNHFNRSDFNYGTDISYNSLEEHVSLLGGVNVDLSREVVLTPSFLIKSDMNTLSYEGSLLATYNDKFYGGVSMREVEAAILILGVNLMKDNRLRVGYAFDYTLEARNAKETTSHEIMLSYRLPALQFFEPTIIRTPRYRHD